MNTSLPIHQRTIVAELLALSSGGIDAYSYLTHGHVFAGMQTGNIILMGISLANGHWNMVLNYLVPIIVFIFGTTMTKFLSMKFNKYKNISRQEFILIFSIILLVLVGIINSQISTLITSLFTSLCIAILFTEFNKLHDMPLTAVMMTGNLKNMGSFFLEGIIKNNRKQIRRGFRMLRIILSFFVGIIINTFLVRYFSFQAIFFNAIILGIVLFIITYENRKSNKKIAGELS